MSKCNHGHDSKNADKWTNTAAVGGWISDYISNLYWLGGFFDTVGEFSPDVLGLSYYAVAFGAVTALLSASGAAYCHRALNMVHQHQDSESGANLGEINSSKHETESSPLQPHQHNHLSWGQKIALGFDFISHIGETAGPLTFITDIATNNGLPTWGKALAQCGATLFGAATSVASVRTCKHAIEQANLERPHQPCSHH